VYEAATEAGERVVCSPSKAAPKMGQLLNVETKGSHKATPQWVNF